MTFLLSLSTQARATDDLWRSTFGQNWFYEMRSSPGEVLAGSWWEASLTPGRTYHITFNVQTLQGRLGVLLGSNAAVPIDRTGTYALDFSISDAGTRRLLFQSLSDNVAATVSQISVSEQGAARAQSNGSASALPKGHYVAIDRERNLKNEMLDVLDRPQTSNSSYALRIARQLDEALRTPGVKGVWMEFEWRTLEPADGKFDWRLADDNMTVARRYGLKFIIKIADRSFDGDNVLPTYFPSSYVLRSNGGGGHGVVAKRWDPYVYNRLIRLHKAIAARYANDPGFGGIATSETATGNFSNGGYSIGQYRSALTAIITQTEAALKTGKLFLYMNFLKGGDNSDMNKDVRVALLEDVPHGALAIGGPDVTPDAEGMPRSATAYRVHVRKTMPSVPQFCHLQNVDQGFAGINVKTNRYRQQYYDEVARVRSRENQGWFNGPRAVFEFDDLRDPQGNQVKLHPAAVLGKLWTPAETFSFGRRNFDCDYFLWTYRERPKPKEFGWNDVRSVIVGNQNFYN